MFDDLIERYLRTSFCSCGLFAHAQTIFPHVSIGNVLLPVCLVTKQKVFSPTETSNQTGLAGKYSSYFEIWWTYFEGNKIHDIAGRDLDGIMFFDWKKYRLNGVICALCVTFERRFEGESTNLDKLTRKPKLLRNGSM